MLMAITILGALYKRRETGQGHRLQVAMQDAIMHYMRINFATQGLTGKPAQRGGSKVPGVNNAPMGLYPCAPGGPNDYVYIMTSRANPDHWDRLLKLMGREDLIGDPRYLTPMDRVAREAEVDEIIAAWTRTRTKHDAMRAVGDAGIPAGAVLDTMELQNDHSFEERGIMQVMRHPVHRDFKMPGWPVRVDGKPPALKSSPVLGRAYRRGAGRVAGVERPGGRGAAGGGGGLADLASAGNLRPQSVRNRVFYRARAALPNAARRSALTMAVFRGRARPHLRYSVTALNGTA